MAMPATALPDSGPMDILEVFEDVDAQMADGYRTELLEGEIVVSPPPDGEHEDIIGDIADQISAKSPTRLITRGNKGLVAADWRLVPDGTVAPAYHFRPHGSWAPTEGVEMVIEVTSGRAAKDRHAKRRAYAQAGIPLYLLIDRSRGEAVLYSSPVDGTYQGCQQQPFGKGLDLPAPFAFTLDTSEFG